MLSVGRLKMLLEGLPDNMPVLVLSEQGCGKVERLEWHDAENDPDDQAEAPLGAPVLVQSEW